MFPQTSINDPFLYTSQEFLKHSFTNDHYHQNPNATSLVELDHPLFLNLPSPFLDVHEFPLSQIFSQDLKATHDQNNNIEKVDLDKTNDNLSREMSRSVEDQSSNPDKRNPIEPLSSPSSKKRKLSAKPRRRSGKKDRHSKICTAQGVRDRRMRLSLQIARKFFDLQDMLGFDKASKTIEWLFSKSNNAIKELSLENNIPQENTCYNNISSSEQNKDSNNEEIPMLDDHGKLRKIESRVKGGAKTRGVTMPLTEGGLMRTDQATKEKTIIKRHKKGKELYETNPKNLENEFAKVGIMESYLGGASCSSIASIFDNYDQNSGSLKEGIMDNSDNCFIGLLENWDITNSMFEGN